MSFFPIEYIDPVFRPPSEGRSLILQVTNGCSWNKCTFCTMYTAEQKRFRPKTVDQIEAELRDLSMSGYRVHKIFLADGDAMTLSFRRLQDIMRVINIYYPNVERVSSYCLPRNLKNKSVEELAELKKMGLTLMYVGCESGDNELLSLVEKGETYESSLAALQKIKQAGMESSVMILNGLGGPELSERHAIQSARLMNEAQPEYLSSLVIELHQDGDRFIDKFDGRWRPLTQPELFNEMYVLLDNLELDNTVFRSDHASNYLVLKGRLGRDKVVLLNTIETAINRPGVIPLRHEWQRGL